MTTSPPESPEGAAEDAAAEAPQEDNGATAGGQATAVAETVAELVGSERWSADFESAKVTVDRDRWVEAVRTVRDEMGLGFFSFLSAIDWAVEVAVGDPLSADEVDERFEVICRLSSIHNNDAVILSADVPKVDPTIDTLIGVFPGANWHERETHEMFGIDFIGHPNLSKLYLPDAFEGYPLRKSFPLLSREVKPWPGLVDVEDMPSTDNPEAGEADEVPEDEEE